ncbi:2 3-bisphosphoglycerate-independent phosphoglycerate mutase [Bienertia sinuspersici]
MMHVVHVIHDEFDPFEGPVWEDDCDQLDNYIERLYNNGELYKDEGYGNIIPKPWLLFTEKQQLRDVIRNYCIQSGFSVVVERVSNHQYTVRCSDQRCPWRLHASKLVDGVTWAIKNIEPSEHSCIETENSMMGTIKCFHWLGPVSSKDEETWSFFVWHLKKLLQATERANNWCIISNRHKHLSVNWKKVYSGLKMWRLFWLTAGAYSDFTFRKAMEQIDKHRPDARIWLANLGEQQRWTKHKFNPYFKCDLRKVSMVRLATRNEMCEQWERSDICPNILKRVQLLCSDSRTCRAYLSGKGEYEIGDAMAYGAAIKTIPDREQWPQNDHPLIQPPVFKRRVGRLVKNRKRGQEEQRKGKRSKHTNVEGVVHLGTT